LYSEFIVILQKNRNRMAQYIQFRMQGFTMDVSLGVFPVLVTWYLSIIGNLRQKVRQLIANNLKRY